ncbi:AarF/UbiB family protein [Butyrivibrio sp. FCS014]|uniref:AarF/UbiB family protein n=1 Tax=Butyrivibrio sp. FCS014 TaxID=1408304 RepID=UPI000465036A|nr:AarF/UbiB family protein [Butyrivibrio sp. FCS014]
MRKTRKKVIQEINTQQPKMKDMQSPYDVEDYLNSTIYFKDNRLMEDSFSQDSESVRSVKLSGKRQDIGKSMPPKYTARDLHDLLSRQDRLVVDLKKERNFDAREASRVKDTQAEVDEINKVLDMFANGEEIEEEAIYSYYTKEEQQEAIKSLNYKKSRDLTQLLINDHSKSDSPEMAALKTEVLRLTYHLEAIRDMEVTRENIEELKVYYAVAIKFCEDYLSTKKHNKRYEKVFAVWQGLSYENDTLSLVKDLDFSNKEDYTMGELLGMSRTKSRNVVRTSKLEIKETLKAEEASDDVINALRVFGADYSIRNAYAAAGNKPKDIQKLVSNNLELMKDLSRFKPGQVQVLDVSVMGKKVRILQTAENQLFAIEKHGKIALNNTAQGLYQQLTNDVMQRPEFYGKDAVVDLLESYRKKTDITKGEYTHIRDNVAEYLAKVLDLKKDDFNNVRRTAMVGYARELAEGKKTPEQIKQILQDAKQDEDLINGIALTELMELDAARGGEMEDHVSMYKVQANADENDWSDDEKAVKKLMAEFVFTSDTLTMDKNADDPKEFVRTVLLDNIKALKLLVEDKSDKDHDLIATIMKKMSLDKVSDDKNDDFAGVIGKGLRKIVEFLRRQKDVDIEKLLRDQNNKDVNDQLELAHGTMEQGIKDSAQIMQHNVNNIVDAMFPEVENDPLEEETLKSIMKNATKTEAGQGLFIRKVLKNYFAKMKTVDQRAMLSSALRSCKKVEVQKLDGIHLFDEIKKKRLSKFKDILDERSYDALTNEKKALIEEYGKEREKLQIQANYFAGLIRGAGPLLHKMLQGFPEDSLPESVKLALRDVKSKLPPIPERVVKTQMNAMIEASGGKVTKIEILKNLGAASVGQTFLCNIYGPGMKEGKRVVIKLLRPDCQNRMKREEKVMLDCAKEVSVGMYETYKGQLGNYYMELDLSQEAKNIEDGQVYNKGYGDVKSEEVDRTIAPTANYLMIKEAPGKTLDDILLDSVKTRKEIHDEVHEKYINDQGKEVVSEVTIPLTDESIKKTKQARDKLIDLANDLIKKRDIMAHITKKWLEEALFGSGYYHADLHAGNILISDTKGTLIDYGNAVNFSDEQKVSITRMMTAAAAGNVDMFFEEFNNLLDNKDEAFKDFYTEDKQAEVKEAFSEILEMGSASEAGERIAAALIRASELGVKLPASIYNFSQGQLRLQKSIDDINLEIGRIGEDLNNIEQHLRKYDNKVLGLSLVIENAYVTTRGRNGFAASIKQQYDSLMGVGEETFKKGLVDNTKKKGNLAKGIAPINKRAEFDDHILGELADFERDLKRAYDHGKLPDFKAYRKKWTDFRDKWKAKFKAIEDDKTLSEEQKKEKAETVQRELDVESSDFWVELLPGKGDAEILERIGIKNLMPALLPAVQTLDDSGVESILTIYEQVIPKGLEIDKKVKDFRRLQDKKELTDDKKTALTNEIYNLYVEYNEAKNKNHPITLSFLGEIRKVIRYDDKIKDLDMMLKETTKTTVKEGDAEVEIAYGELFNKKLEEYHKLAEKYANKNEIILNMTRIPQADKEKITKLLTELGKIHMDITKIQLKRFMEGRYDRDIDIKSIDFTDVMQELISDNKAKFAGNVGIGNLILMGGKAAFSYFFG